MSAESRFDLALLTCAQMGECDRWTIAQGYASGIDLMERAGAAVADAADALAPGPVHVLCGPGNNGGDGYVAARLLAARGRTVMVHALGPPKPSTDARLAADAWQGEVRSLDAFAPGDGDGLVIDALFGAGFRGALPEGAAAALARARGLHRLAVDVPSGLDGDTGHYPFGMPCDATVTFFRRKPGHVTGAGPEACGRLIVADIGVRSDFDGPRAPTTFENGPALWHAHLPVRGRAAHKYRVGHAAVFSGPEFGSGAARLSAMAAARSGAGAVTLLGSAAALRIHAAHVSSIMLRPCAKGQGAEALDALNAVRAVVLGPGFGDPDEARAIARHCLEREGMPLILDADGITAFEEAPETMFAPARRHTAPMLVLTPHEGEFARLFPDIAADDSIGKPARARAAAARSGAVIVFKGADTVIAHQSGEAVITTNATPALATAGSGDVLAGLIAGLAAQGMAPFDAACAGVWIHAEAGCRAGPVCIAEDLINALRPLPV